MSAIGHNSDAGRELVTIVERVEKVRADKKELGALESAILADAKSRGFVPARIRDVVKRRAMKPQERQEAEAVLDTYLHATGDAIETPIHRLVGTMSADIASRDAVIDVLKRFVPEDGAITVEHGGKPVRLSREKGGEVQVDENPVRPPAGPEEAFERELHTGPNRSPPPDVDEAGAEALGGEAFRGNRPIVENPFPFGDARRPRWDRGWRDAAGNDGMGPGNG